MGNPTPKELRAVLREGSRHDLVSLFVPSHDRQNEPVNDRDIWSDEAMQIFADLYGGATAIETHKGIYKSTEGTTKGQYLWDQPILIQSYAPRELVENLNNLRTLLDFMSRMRKDMRQEAVLFLVNDYRWFIGGD